MMELSFVLIIAACSLVSADNDNTTNTTRPPNNTATACPCNNVPPAAPASPSSRPAPPLGIITVSWTYICRGHLVLNINSSSLPVCHRNASVFNTILGNVCQNKRGCKGLPKWDSSYERQKKYYNLTEEGSLLVLAQESPTSNCKGVEIRCEVEKLPDFEGQLYAYKVVTALLSIVLIVLLLMRFTRPTVTALQKRLSDRRQHRWVGPTQSHSVSYHRGKSAVKNEDEEKRFSYPALERLTVGGSSPSCNRNSYNF
ncbi:uncharacterized protein LOC119772946 [Cyprinodon tularosa]|uniref:uncharacterized protein LOC119772946 n=1 Tax=Cyprinodon tularosa TaxID=77115 RepID=UPI0018E21F19|nr:uncharacterized protein LOC119772946 [Cyprinodon tularosa]